MSNIETLDGKTTQSLEEKFAGKHGSLAFIPKSDVVETSEEIKIWCEMPGADSQSVETVLEKNILRISGRSVDHQTPEGYTLNKREYLVGNYQNTFVIPEEIDRDAIQAKVKNGVLCVILPKSKKLAPRKIEVLAE